MNPNSDVSPRRFHVYPATVPERRPSAWWYYGRALYVSRRDYFKIYCALMLTLGIPMVFLNRYFEWPFWKVAALESGTVSLFYLGYSLLVGMYRMYGHPGQQYVKRLLDRSGASDAKVVADLHIGTYRHSHTLADLLPDAVIHSVDCWNAPGDAKELAIRDVRDLECAPTHNPRIQPTTANNYTLPLPDNCFDAVVFGFGTHEISNDGSRQKLFEEAKRILKPGGHALMFEHGYDFHNVIIFGPVIGHVVTKEEWMREFKTHFGKIGYARSSHAVDLFWGTKEATVGTVEAPLPESKGLRGNFRDWIVVLLFSVLSLAVVAYVPDAQLMKIYYGIAILGLVWPWLTIAGAVLCDRVARWKATRHAAKTPMNYACV